MVLSQPKEKTICIRVSLAQDDVIHSAMAHEGIPFLSQFARAAMLDLAERILEPIDLADVRVTKEIEDQKPQLRRMLHELESAQIRGEEKIDPYHVSSLINLARAFLRNVESLLASGRKFR